MLTSLCVYVVFLTFPLIVLIQFCVLPNQTRRGFWFLGFCESVKGFLCLLWDVLVLRTGLIQYSFQSLKFFNF